MGNMAFSFLIIIAITAALIATGTLFKGVKMRKNNQPGAMAWILGSLALLFLIGGNWLNYYIKYNQSSQAITGVFVSTNKKIKLNILEDGTWLKKEGPFPYEKGTWKYFNDEGLEYWDILAKNNQSSCYEQTFSSNNITFDELDVTFSKIQPK